MTRWYRRFHRRDDLSRLVRDAAGTTFVLTDTEFLAVRQLLEEPATWNLLGRGTVEDIATRVTGCLPPTATRSKEEATTAGRVIARGLLEFATSQLDQATYQQVVLTRLNRLQTDQASALDRALLEVHADLATQLKTGDQLDAQRFASITAHLRRVLDRLPARQAGRGEVVLYLTALAEWLAADPSGEDARVLAVDPTGIEVPPGSLPEQFRRLLVVGETQAESNWMARQIVRRSAERAMAELADGAILEEVNLPVLTTWNQLTRTDGDIRTAVIASAVNRLPDLGGSRTIEAIHKFFVDRQTMTLLVIDSFDEQDWTIERLRQVVSLPWGIALVGRPSVQVQSTTPDDWTVVNLIKAVDVESIGSSPAVSFDLEELHRIVLDALQIEDATFQSVEVHARTATFLVVKAHRNHVAQLQVKGSALERDSDRELFTTEVSRMQEASYHFSLPRVARSGLTDYGYPFLVQTIDRRTLPCDLPLPAELVMDVGAKLADALSYMHGSDATFGTIKPENIRLSPEGDPFLAFPRLPFFGPAGSSTATPESDVHDLCSALLSMLRRAAHPSTIEARTYGALLDAMQQRLSAALLRDRLNTLKRETTPTQADFDFSATFTIRGKTQPVEAQVSIITGDLFEQPTHIVVGFSDTFDTSTDDSVVISSSSLQGQLISRVYDGNVEKLDRELHQALAGVPVESTESREAKALGKLDRYPIGTVAVLTARERLVFAVAVSRMQNNLLARASFEFLQRSLNSLWETIRTSSGGQPVAMPIIGSGLARTDMSREELLHNILLSFREQTQLAPICHDLRIIVHPSDAAAIDIMAVASSALTNRE